MDLVLLRRYRRSGGTDTPLTWEFREVTSWDGAPAPALVGKRLVETATGDELSPRWAGLVNNLTHWGYGCLMGVGYGFVIGARPPVKVVPAGLAWGAGVWASSYVALPILGLYEPIWKYDATPLLRDLTAHLAYGATTAMAFQAIPFAGD